MLQRLIKGKTQQVTSDKSPLRSPLYSTDPSQIKEQPAVVPARAASSTTETDRCNRCGRTSQRGVLHSPAPRWRTLSFRLTQEVTFELYLTTSAHCLSCWQAHEFNASKLIWMNLKERLFSLFRPSFSTYAAFSQHRKLSTHLSTLVWTWR